ncbi:signal recognition particle 19 kDa protein [Anoplophora glabripennis]|uniref:Signal recognition particle n=1 Tax=Anoplophora glabripennis TaxID=217634 RepID=V5IAW8_ANOGL|nr:signal recognition particle 19 kDa protein [Anoplophora glabripennis]
MQSHSGVPILQWSPDKKYSDRERWICIYPAYINSKKTLAQGRKIAKEKCVENPTHQEIRDVLVAAGMKVGVENKLYSRERSKELQYRGRIRVQLKNDDGSLFNSEFPTRESIMNHLGEMIPKLKSRLNKGAGEQPLQSTGSNKGKGKGKGRR